MARRPEAATPPRPSPSELVAECAKLDLAGRIRFAGAWGCDNPKNAPPPSSRGDWAVAKVLLASAIVWTFLEDALAEFRRGKEQKSRATFAHYVRAARGVASQAARVGIEPPPTWFGLPPDLVGVPEWRGADRARHCSP
jgi:hypothetical protein